MFGNLFNSQSKKLEEGVAPVSPVAPNSSMAQMSNQSPQTTGQLEQNGTSQVQVTGSKLDPALRQNLSALSHLDQRTTQVLQHAQEETKRIRQSLIEPEQVLIGLLYDADIFKLLEEFSVDPAKLTKDIQSKEQLGTFTGQPTLSEKSKQIFEQAYRDAKSRESAFITPEDVLLVLFNETISTANLLQAQGINKNQLQEKLTKTHGMTYGKKSVMDKYGVDLTQEAKEGKLDPIAGRDKEIDRLTHILLRRTKNNPIIIGEAGVGKTAIVEGLAQSIASGKVPKELIQKRIFQLDISSLVAGASHRGEFEERIRGVINEAMASNGTIILFIDEIHTILGTGDQEGSLDAANIIKPHLARGHLQIIGTTTTTEYRKHFEKDKAFARRFQPIVCEEPSVEAAIEMIKVLRLKYETYHKVKIPDETIEAAVKLSKKYIGERYLPDKAVDLVDEAAADVRLQQSLGKSTGDTVTKVQVEQVVSNWTGIPITKLTEDESAKLLELEKRIHQRLIDQEEAVVAVSEAVRRGRIGLASGQRPIASFVFLGPSGVGKTELAKTLAEILFGKDDAMIRLDMSEYMEKHEVAKLIGAPPGYVGYEEGGQLTEAVRTKPYSIVLLDEVEKAHPDVFNILLQLLEDGRLTDNKGNTISFKNTIVICTSNIGSAVIQQKLSEQDAKSKPTTEEYNKQFAELSKIVGEELRKFFRPELLNRFDDVVIFKPLRREDMMGVTKLGIDKTRKLLKEQGYELNVTEAALEKLSIEGYDPVYGARPLRRLVQTSIENPIALQIIGKKFAVGDTIVIDYDKTTNEFQFKKESKPTDPGQKVGQNAKVTILQTPEGFVSVKMQPLAEAQEVTKVKTAESYEILEENAEWVKIKLADGSSGWVLAKNVQKQQAQAARTEQTQQPVVNTEQTNPVQHDPYSIQANTPQDPNLPPAVAATTFDPMSVLPDTQQVANQGQMPVTPGIPQPVTGQANPAPYQYPTAYGPLTPSGADQPIPPSGAGATFNSYANEQQEQPVLEGSQLMGSGMEEIKEQA